MGPGNLLPVLVLALAGVGLFYLIPQSTLPAIQQPDTCKGLENFSEITKLDPLFYSPYANASSLEQELGWYMDYEQMLLSNASSPDLKELLKRTKSSNLSVMPHQFLGLLPKNIRDTEAFYDNPTCSNAKNLIETNKKTALAYKKGAQDFLATIDIFLEIVEKSKLNSGTTLSSVNGTGTNMRQYKEDLELVLTNSDALRYEISKRRQVLSGNGTINTNLTRYEVKTPQKLDIIVSKEEIIGVENKYLEGRDYEIKGPYEITTPCFGLEQERHLFYYGTITKKGTSRFNAELSYMADGRVYERTPKINGTNKLTEDRNLWTRDSGLADCRCLLSPRDKIQLFTVNFMYESLNSARLYDGVYVKPESAALAKLNKTVDDGNRLEEMFLEYPSQSILDELSKNYRAAYQLLDNIEKESGQNKTRESTNLQPKKERLLEYSLAADNKIFSLAQFLNQYKTTVRERAGVYSSRSVFPLEFMVLDAQYPLFFAPWSKTIWRVEQPKFLIETTDGKGPFIMEH